MSKFLVDMYSIDQYDIAVEAADTTHCKAIVWCDNKPILSFRILDAAHYKEEIKRRLRDYGASGRDIDS